MKIVTDAEFENALSVSDNICIMQAVIGDFKYVTRTTLEQLSLIGLWKALLNFDPERKAKFTTYLYKCVRWQVLNHLRKKKDRTASLEGIIEISYEAFNRESLFDSLSDIEKEMLQKRDFENMTLKEMSLEYGTCIETMRVRMERIYGKIEEDYTA